MNRNENSDYKTGSGDYKTNLSMSTTGNVYGIYDMSGGAWEHVAAYVDSTKNGSAENIYLTTEEYGKALYEAAPKYKDVYIVSDEESGIKNYEENYFVYGDAVYETSYTSYDGNTDGTNEAAWHSDRSSFPYRDRPFFNRGGAYKDGYKNGVFAFASTTGTSTLGDGFRVTLTVL